MLLEIWYHRDVSNRLLGADPGSELLEVLASMKCEGPKFFESRPSRRLEASFYFCGVTMSICTSH